MRTFSSSVSGELAKQFGVEPVIFIGVKWGGEDETFYSGTTHEDAVKAILNISGLETTQVLQGTAATQSVTITLSDTSGDLTTVLNTQDIHKRPAKVYLGFPGLAISESVTLLDGEINSDIIWDERARTLTFTILSKIEGRLFGFAVEDGLFHKVDDRARTTPWPFRFGETCVYPAVEIQNGISGLLSLGQGVLDATIDAKICAARKINCPLIPDPATSDPPISNEENVANARSEFALDIAADPFSRGPNDTFGARLARPTNLAGTADTGLTHPDTGGPLIRDRECERGKFQTLCQLLRDRANQLVYVQPYLFVRGGLEFPQNQEIQVRVDDVVYTGVMTSELFTISTTNRLDKPTENVDCKNISPLTQGYRRAEESAPTSLAQCETPTQIYELRVIGGAGEAWRNLGDISDSSFKWLPAGTRVHLESSSTRVHVVSLVPGIVTGVYAYRTFGDTKQLTELPGTYYEVVETDYGDLTAVEIHLDRSLKSYPDEKWEEKLYVKFDSDVGPNPVDVIEWIVDRYTDFTIDAASFAAVHTSLTNYPCNYYHASKTNVFAVLNQIAYEARCALTITDNVVKLTYLPLEPTTVKSFTGADIIAGSFSFLHSRTEELVTSHAVTWEPYGASLLSTDTHIRKFTIENNVNRYGYFGTGRTYDTITNETQAIKTATFWNIRESNTWRLVQFSTTLEHMNLELFDAIDLNIDAFPNVKVVVIGMSIDPAAGTVQLLCWTPVLSGTTEEYLWAWPSQKNPLLKYPQANREVELPPIQLTPPEDHPLYIDDPNFAIPPSTGDRFPSDLDDVFPDTECQDLNDPALIDAIEPLFNRIGFPTDTGQQATRADEVAAAGPSFNFEEPEEIMVCGRPSFEECVWEVTVGYGSAVTIAVPYPDLGGTSSGTLSSGCRPIVGGPCKQDRPGPRCYPGPSFNWCKTFGSDLMAQAYADSIRAQIDAGFCSWHAGGTGPIYVVGPTKRDNTGEAESCVGMGSTETSSTGPSS